MAFSCAVFCKGQICGSERDYETKETMRCSILGDAALILVYSILASLGLNGVLPMAVGITFTVLTVLQALTMFAARAYISNK